MEQADYNGWENKFTWLMHLHLSSDYALLQEMAALVAGTPHEQAAGIHMKWWVEDTVNGWVMGSADRDTFHDEPVRLLAWDLVGAALAYADWNELVQLLMGQGTMCDNVFTKTLHETISTMTYFQRPVQVLMQSVSSPFAYADALQEWFKEQVDRWVEASARHRQQCPAVLMLVHHLIHNTFGVVSWEHVGRAFRPE